MRTPRTIDVCGLSYRVVFVSPKRMGQLPPKDSAVEGYTVIGAGVIYLATSLKKNPSRLRDTLMHEILGHALWDACGLEHFVHHAKKRGRAYWSFQEAFIRIHTPALITTLRSLGALP